MREIRLIALDLDYTLLGTDKTLSERNRRALERAAERGVEIVPTTGRFYLGMPEAVRALPFIRFAITVNGAQLYDVNRRTAAARAELPYRRAIEIMSALDEQNVVYDCYMDDWGWMSSSFLERAEEFAPDVYYLRMLRSLRTPVPELKAFLLARRQDVQKVQAYFTDKALRRDLLSSLGKRFPYTAVSASLPTNIEINLREANKGEALLKLAARLGIPAGNTMAIGDGLNDLSMIRDAGVGVAMRNACPEILSAADEVTAGCDEDGVALAIEKYCL